MENLLKWIDSHPKEAKRLSEQAEEKAWRNFKAKFPNADLSKFVAQVDMTDKTHATAQINLVIVPGQHWQIVSPNPKDWSVEMKKALGFGGFPIELILNSNPSNPVPAVPFSDKIPESFGEILNQPIKIFVKPNESFTTKFREIFAKTKITHKTAKESRKWLNQPNMDHWPQQLNFAFWCATTASGISRHLVNSLPPQIKSFLLFHIYFTTRRILFEMGGIQSESALPGDPTFSQTENKFDIPSYKRICAEFQISPNADFRFTFGQNFGLGYVNIFYPGEGDYAQKHWIYPPATLQNPSSQRFSDEGGTDAKGNRIDFIRNDQGADKQFEFFMSNGPLNGLSQAGMARINQSIEAFVYCILGAQVNVRSSILGEFGGAKEAQREFLVLMEDAIRQPDLSKSISRYQLAIDEAKVRLDLAISPGTWLMPSNFVINTQSTVGYNNNLKKATGNMKLGVNSDVNVDLKKVGARNMDGGQSKNNRSTSHSSNPENENKNTKPPSLDSQQVTKQLQEASENQEKEESSQHETFKSGVIIAASLGAFAIYRIFR